MAWITGIRRSQVGFWLRGDLAWVGAGLAEVGLSAGGPVDPDMAGRLLAGRHPITGQVLLTRKKAVGPLARVPAGPYVAAVQDLAAAAGRDPGALFTTVTLRARWERMARGVSRDSDRHTIPIADLERLAAAGVVDLADVYPEEVLRQARAHRNDRVTSGNRGFAVHLNVPKSVSVLYAIAGPDTAAAIEAEYLAAVAETVTAIEAWAGHGLTGRQGDGHRAARIASTGMIGWTMVQRSALPVRAGEFGDPHLHAQAVLANMVRCVDGKWRAPGSGAQDIYRHVAAIGEFVQARVRNRLTARLGVTWTLNPRNQAWEISGLPETLLQAFSQRTAEIVAHDEPDGTAWTRRSIARRLSQPRAGDESLAELRSTWYRRAAQLVSIPAVLQETLPGTHTRPASGPSCPITQLVDMVMAQTSTASAPGRPLHRRQILPVVAAACQFGVDSLDELEALTDDVADAVPTMTLPRRPRHPDLTTDPDTTRQIAS